MSDSRTPSPPWRNWSGAQHARPRNWLRPQDEAGLIDALRTLQGPLRIAGSGHSFSALCVAEDTLLTLEQLRGVIDHDPDILQASVWAGTSLHELGPALWERGQSLTNQGDVDPQTVAGACATSTHGTGRTLGSFSAAVRGLRLVTVDGEVLDVDAGRDAEIYQAARTSLGALGIATRIRLQNAAAYRLREHEYLMPRAELMADLDRLTRAHRHFEFWTFFDAERAVVKTLDVSDEPDTPPPRFALPVSTVLNLASEIAHGVPGMAGPMQRLLTALHSPTRRVGPAFRIFPSPRDARFNEMEYELPIERGPACLDEILHTVRRAGLRTLFPLEYRTVAADDAWLSPFFGRESASISVHQYHRADWRPLFSAVEPILRKHGGRPHWGKLHSLTARELAPLYPHWEDFQRVRRRLDPRGRLLNAHLRAVFGA